MNVYWFHLTLPLVSDNIIFARQLVYDLESYMFRALHFTHHRRTTALKRCTDDHCGFCEWNYWGYWGIKWQIRIKQRMLPFHSCMIAFISNQKKTKNSFQVFLLWFQPQKIPERVNKTTSGEVCPRLSRDSFQEPSRFQVGEKATAWIFL